MDDPRWKTVDDYLANLLVPDDPSLSAAREANRRADLPAIDVSPLQGKLLHILARIVQAKNILEIGTLGGYSTIWLARALLPGGRLITLEANPKHAAVARSNLEKAGLADVAEVRLGRAADTLRQLEAEGRGPFDLIFLDADKPSNAEYLGWAVRLGRPGTVIICDNVVRDGAVIDSTTTDPDVQGSRRFLDVLAAEPRVIATALQTVGWKGYDGFAIGVVGQR